MPRSERRIVRADILADAEFAGIRRQRRAELLPVKRLRRVALGPYCTFYFESFETMLLQVQEMLLIERGGEEQIADELAAYNPLIPQGDELVATVMFEVDDPHRRARLLSSLGGVEEHFYLQVGEERVPGMPEGDVERTREDGKTSAVHFLRFLLSPRLKATFTDAGTQVMLGCNDERYPHLAVIGMDARQELARDFV
jgi:hypothetical protein